jgi:putative ABC transport system permease protein
MRNALSRLASRWRMLTGSAAGATVGLAVLVFVCAFVAMAGPRASEQLQTNTLRQVIAQTPATKKIIIGAEAYAVVSNGTTKVSLAQLAKVTTQLRSQLKSLPLAPARADAMVLTSGLAPIYDPARNLGSDGRQLELIYASGFAGHVRLVKGRLPTTARPVSIGRAKNVIGVAVTIATARRFGLTVGSLVPLFSAPMDLKVTGIFRPVGRSSPFWQLDPTASIPDLITPSVGEPYWQGGAFFGSGSLTAVENLLTNIQLRWTLPLRVGQLTANQARALAQTLPDALAQDGNGIIANPVFPPFSVVLTSSFVTVLSNFVSQITAVSGLLSLLSVSLTAIGTAVLLLAIWLLTEQRQDDFAMLRARGASTRQLGLMALRSCLLLVALGAAAGLAVAFRLTPGSGAALGWWLAGLTVLVVLAGIPALTMLRHRGTASMSSRPDRRAGKRAATRRVVTEAALVLGAAGGVITLRDQGLAPGGSDPYTSLAPVLVAIPVAVVVLRCYPLLIRPLLRLTGRRRGVAVFVGLARAVRTSATTALPVFAMVLALALVAFAGMLRSAVLRGDVAASWQALGADAVVSAPGGLTPGAQRALSAVPGVQRSAAISLSSALFPDGNRQFGVVLVDPASYAALVAGTGAGGSGSPAAALLAGSHSRGGVVAALTSPGFPMRRPGGVMTVDVEQGAQPVRIRSVGQASMLSVISNLVGDQYVVLPEAVLGSAAPQPAMLLVNGSAINHRKLAAVARKFVPGSTVSFRSSVLAGLETAPLQHGAYVGFALGGATAAILSMFVLLLTLILGARSRELTVARLATMGLSADQGRKLVVVESLPQILAAVIGGVACAALLAPLVGPALDLSVFTQTSTGVPVRIEPTFLAIAAAALVVLALLTLALQTKLASRSLTSALRIGE